MDYENFEARVRDPIRIKLGLEKLKFQILRRTFATLAVGERKGTLKDVHKQCEMHGQTRRSRIT